MLAYLFWHRSQPGVARDAYEDAQRRFHARLEIPSASFRTALPFGDRGEAYEDWYLVDDWHGLGELNAAAVDATRRPHHDLAATMAGNGWGGIYALLRGQPKPPDRTHWLDRPRGEDIDDFVSDHDAASIWQRQMVLGPAPELCLSTPGDSPRTRIWPAG